MYVTACSLKLKLPVHFGKAILTISDTTIKAFQTLGRAVPNATTLSNVTLPFSQVAPGQLGLNESDIPAQPVASIGNSTLLTGQTGNLSWPLALEVEWANRSVMPLVHQLAIQADNGKILVRGVLLVVLYWRGD